MIKRKRATIYFKLDDYVVGESVFTHSMYRCGKIKIIRTKYIDDNELLVVINNEKSFLEMIVSNPDFIFRCIR